MKCYGCDIETDMEAEFKYTTVDKEIVIYLCGYCSDKVKKFIERSLP